MDSHYTIVVPIFNEAKIIPDLLYDLKKFQSMGHEILIVDDGSNDGSYDILAKCDFISLIRLEKNLGKGAALRNGIKKASNNKIILFDGDRELKTSDIQNLMILNNKKIQLVFANRKMSKSYNSFIWILGNKILTFIFNTVHNANLADVLCCAKAFYKTDLNLSAIKSNRFDVDVEITCHLIKNNSSFKTIPFGYYRRNANQGKKLRLRDGLSILYRIITC